MATILLANELGGGLGHVNRLLAIARRLRDHRLAFALPDPEIARRSIAADLGPSCPITACIAWDHAAAADNVARDPPKTLADTLFLFGFSDADRLRAAVDTWCRLLDRFAPDLVVSDFAPTLRLAVAGRIPNVVIGSGFTVPPPGSPLPRIEPRGRSAPPDESRRREAAVLAAVNTRRAELGLPSFAAASDLFQGDRTFPASLDRLDPYRGLRLGPVLLPFNIPSLPIGPAFRYRTGPHVFSYLDADYSGIDVVLSALNGMVQPSQVFVRNFEPRELLRHCGPQVSVHQGQADFRMLLPQTRLLIHHGGLGTTTAGLLAGVPQVLLPRHFEQRLTVSGLEPLNCAVALELNAGAEVSDLRSLLGGLLDNPVIQDNAMAAARSLQDEMSTDPQGPVIDACRQLMIAGRAPAVSGHA